MARWKNDPQNREIIKEVTQDMELPIYKASAKGTFIPWLKESWNKIEDKYNDLKDLTNTKEPKIDKKSGFNLEKTNEYLKDNSDFLLDTKGSKKLYDDIMNVINSLDKCPYKVGDIYITTNSTNPALVWQGTTWQKIEARFLKASTGNEVAGALGGKDFISLTIANLPAHNHTGTTSTAGNHAHTQTAHSHTQVSHAHPLPYSTGAGWGQGDGLSRRAPGGVTGNFMTTKAGGENTGAAQPAIQAAGNHNHTFTTSTVGNGAAIDIRPTYIVVHIWKRIG